MSHGPQNPPALLARTGTLRHSVALLALALASPAGALAQAGVGADAGVTVEAPAAPESPSPERPAAEEVVPPPPPPSEEPAPSEEPSEEAVPAQEALDDGPGAAGGLAAPRQQAPTRPRAGWGDPDAPPPSGAMTVVEEVEVPPGQVRRGSPPPPAAPAAPARPRDWRYPRRMAQRPITLPQGVMRFDSTISVAVHGNLTATGFFGLAAGLHDDFEIGGTPVANTFLPGLVGFNDPEFYVRARALSGELQLAFRTNVVIPTRDRNTQWGLTAELAWLANPWFRLETALDAQFLFDAPAHMRIGVPLAATLQAGINSFTLTTALYVFNDFDDVDVPLLARYAVAFGGHQGPITEAGFEGGFLDLSAPDVGRAWMFRGVLTWFAYL